jgi:AcrR family transcriptional regulator
MSGTPGRVARKRRGRPRLATPETRRHHILDAAVRLLADAGDRTVTIDAIAREADLVRAQVYEVFPSKDALVAAAVEREARRINDYIVVAGRRAFEQPLPERIRSLYRSIFDYSAAFPHSLALLGTFEEMVPHPGTDRWRDLVAARIRKEFAAAGFPSRQLPDVLSTMLMGLVAATARRTFDEPGWDPDAVVEYLATFTLGGFDALMKAPEAAIAVDMPRPRRPREAAAADERD